MGMSTKKWGASLFVLFGSMMVFSLLSYLFLKGLFGESFEESQFRLAMTVSAFTMFLSVVCTYGFLSINPFRANNPLKVVALAFLGFVAYLLCDLLVSIVGDRGFLWESWNYKLGDFAWVSVIFVGALAEELIFRKYLISLCRALGAGLVVSILISSILFSLFHLGGFENPVPLIIAGVVYCITSVMTKSIGFAVGAHFAYNVFAGIESVESFDHSLTSSSEIIDSILLDASLLTLFLFGYYLYRHVGNKFNGELNNYPA